MIQISGLVERITFYNQSNGYSVIKLRPEYHQVKDLLGIDLEGLITVVGILPALSPGENVHLMGDYRTHPKHGLQFEVSICKKVFPETLTGIERYLGSGLIKGIGPQLAKRIVGHFKEKSLEIIENSPQELQQVPGIGSDRTAKIVKAWEEQRQIKDIMLFLYSHKISTNLAVKIYKTYGDQALQIVKQNPYQLEQDIYGVGFKTADRIAQDLGLPSDHASRIEAGIIYIMNEFLNEGHVYTPILDLMIQAKALLGVDEAMIKSGLERLALINRIKLDSELDSSDWGVKVNEYDPEASLRGIEPIAYLTPYYFSEIGVANCLNQLNSHPVKPRQGRLDFDDDRLSTEQQRALEIALLNPVSIITGGPGTGKTTCLKVLIELLEKYDLKYALASPTGRAAKRLSEATARPASTIHRLLGFTPGKGFQYNEKHPLKIDYLIIDEASMLDLLLTFNLLRALSPGTQLLLVGDVDQLPSVGAGDVLRDIICSDTVPISRLFKIFRQAEDSNIISNAHCINQGKMPILSKTLQGDFYLFPAEDAEKAAAWVVNLVSSRIPVKFSMDPINDIQVLSPMYRGAAGVDALNKMLQNKLNPPLSGVGEQELFGRIFRVGDKVMQIRNNYDRGVFNGDIGRIAEINRIDQTLTVVLDENRSIRYDFTEADELVLAYAISVHKSQGSEFPVIVLPVLTQHYVMLQRNLIYTAITRARKLCIIVGNQKAIRIAINNNKQSKRNSLLSERLCVND